MRHRIALSFSLHQKVLDLRCRTLQSSVTTKSCPAAMPLKLSFSPNRLSTSAAADGLRHRASRDYRQRPQATNSRLWARNAEGVLNAEHMVVPYGSNCRTSSKAAAPSTPIALSLLSASLLHLRRAFLSTPIALSASLMGGDLWYGEDLLVQKCMDQHAFN